MAETLVELVAKITADANELKKALTESEKGIEGLGKKTDKETRDIANAFKDMGRALAVVGASIMATMTGAVISFTRTGSELHDLSLKTGVSAKSLAGLKYAAEQGGASLGTIEMAIRRTSTALIDAKEGSTEITKAFDRMGLSLTSLEGLNPEEQFLKIAGAIANIPDPMSRAATAVDLFGQSGTDMLPMLSEGEEGLRKMMEAGINFSKWTEDGAKKADELGDAFDTLKTSTTGLFNIIGTQLSPALKTLAEFMTDITKGIGDWAKANPQASQGLTSLTTSVGLFASLSAVLILSLPILIKYFGSLGIVAKTLGFTIGGLVGIVGLLVAGFALLGFGLLTLADIHNKSTKITELNTKAIEESKKMLAGQANTYKDVLAQQIALVESYPRLTKADQAWIVQAKIRLSLLINEETKIKAVKEANEALVTTISNAIAKYEYENTVAGQMGLTLDDVIVSAHYLNLSGEKITQTLSDLGDKGTDVNEVLRAFGYTEEQVGIITGKTTKVIKDQKEAYENLANEIQDIIYQYNYERSEAGKLNITRKDIITTLLIQGQTEDEIASKLLALGTEQNNVNKILEIFGLEAKQVNDILAENTRLLGENTEAYKTRMTVAQMSAQAAVEKMIAPHPSRGFLGFGEWDPEEGLLQKRKMAFSQLYPFKSGMEEEFWGKSLESLVGFQHGGIVENTGPAFLHQGETVIPANENVGNIIVQFTQPVFFDREDTMNKFVDMIRKGIQRQDRIRFGGAYSG